MPLTLAGENVYQGLYLTTGNKYLCLFNELPTSVGTDGEEVPTIIEGVSTGYTRMLIPDVSLDPLTGMIYNDTQIQFPVATIAWGDVKGFGVATAITGGTIEWYDTIVDLNNVVTILTVVSGAIVIILQGGMSLALHNF